MNVQNLIGEQKPREQMLALELLHDSYFKWSSSSEQNQI